MTPQRPGEEEEYSDAMPVIIVYLLWFFLSFASLISLAPRLLSSPFLSFSFLGTLHLFLCALFVCSLSLVIIVSSHTSSSSSDAADDHHPLSAQAELVGDEAAQAFVDADALTRRPRESNLDLSEFDLLTRVPLRISEHVRAVSFDRCASLTSVAGLPLDVTYVNFTGCVSLASVAGLSPGVRQTLFTGCSSLTSVAGLPLGVTHALFDGCTSLKSVVGLPGSMRVASFQNCTSLISTKGLPASLKSADFHGCIRLHRRDRRHWINGNNNNSSNKAKTNDALHCTTATTTTALFFGDRHTNPADDVRACMRSGVGDRLLARVGPDVALLIGCFATAGFNSSPQCHDRMDSREQLLYRFYTASDL